MSFCCFCRAPANHMLWVLEIIALVRRVKQYPEQKLFFTENRTKISFIYHQIPTLSFHCVCCFAGSDRHVDSWSDIWRNVSPAGDTSSSLTRKYDARVTVHNERS